MVWQKIRAGLMLGIACIASPCCTPFIVPLGLALLAGTPVAVWLTPYIGWLYSGLTLVSVISLVLGLRWLGQKKPPQPPTGSQAGRLKEQQLPLEILDSKLESTR